MMKVRVCDKLISLLLVLVFVSVYSGFFAIYTSAGDFLPDGIHSFYIGKNRSDGMVAEFNSDFTQLHVFISGWKSDGIMKDWLSPDDSNYDYNPFLEHADTLKKVIIDDGVKNIGAYFCYECSCLENVVLPESIVEIGNSSFRKTGITALKLPSGFRFIGERAFSGCHSLKGDIFIPDSVIEIGDSAFYNCDAVDGELILGKSVRSIGNFAFDRCFNMTGTPVFPSSLESIGAYCFENCEHLSGNLVLNEGLRHIGDGAFNHCKKFSNTTLVIPSTVTSIGGDTVYSVTVDNARFEGITDEYYNHGSHVFYDFANSTLKAFEVESGNPSFGSVDGVLYSADNKRLVAYPSSREGAVYEIPEGVEIIDEMAFGKTALSSASEPLKEIVLSNSYTIRFNDDYPNTLNREAESSLNSAIYHFSSVSRITVKPDNTKYSEYDGCVYTKDMTELICVPSGRQGIIELPTSADSVNNGAFAGCNSVEYFIFHKEAVNISNVAFISCNNPHIIGYKGSHAEKFSSEHSYEYSNFGDLNCDGVFSLDDYTLLKSVLENDSYSLSGLQKILADYDRDSSIDAFDLFCVDKEINLQ